MLCQLSNFSYFVQLDVKIFCFVFVCFVFVMVVQKLFEFDVFDIVIFNIVQWCYIMFLCVIGEQVNLLIVVV